MSRIALPLALLLTLPLTACHSTPSDSSAAAPSADVPATETASPTSPSSTPPVADVARQCDAGKAQSAIGKVASQDVVDNAVSDSGSRTVRVIKPGQVVTMDFREDRLNIEVDAGNVVTAVRCG